MALLSLMTAHLAPATPVQNITTPHPPPTLTTVRWPRTHPPKPGSDNVTSLRDIWARPVLAACPTWLPATGAPTEGCAVATRACTSTARANPPRSIASKSTRCIQRAAAPAPWLSAAWRMTRRGTTASRHSSRPPTHTQPEGFIRRAGAPGRTGKRVVAAGGWRPPAHRLWGLRLWVGKEEEGGGQQCQRSCGAGTSAHLDQ